MVRLKNQVQKPGQKKIKSLSHPQVVCTKPMKIHIKTHKIGPKIQLQSIRGWKRGVIIALIKQLLYSLSRMKIDKNLLVPHFGGLGLLLNCVTVQCHQYSLILLDWLSSSYTQIHEPWPKIRVQQLNIIIKPIQKLNIIIKPNFWPNIMSFKMCFNGFYEFYVYKLWLK